MGLKKKQPEVLNDVIDQTLGSKVPLHAKNAIRNMMGEKDQKIRVLETETDELRIEIRHLAAENFDKTHQINILDKVIDDNYRKYL